MIARRRFIAGLGATAAWPLAARGQQGDRVRRIGVLMNGVANDALGQSRVAALIEGLRRLGWIEGRNLRIEVRWSAADVELARIYAAQLIGLMPDVILAATTLNLTAVRQATNTIPVVFLQVSDPIAQGFVASVNKPEANLTGFSLYDFSLGGKWLDLLKEITPDLARVAVMFNPDASPQSTFFISSVETAAAKLGLQAVSLPVHTTAEIEPALQGLARQPNGGLLLPTDSFIGQREKLIGDLALRYRLPTIGQNQDAPRQGVLLYYGVSDVNINELYRQAATYIDRIFKGTKVGDLPVQNADKYTLVINVRTAKALGITIPPTLLALADEVVE